MLKIENLCVAYGQIKVLHDVCLRVKEGEIVAIVGSNGSGKTTLLMSISGIIDIGSGRMTFLNCDITRSKADKIVEMGICHVPEGRHIFPTLSVYDNLQMGAFLRKKKNERKTFRQDLEFAFKIFPILEERQKQKGGTLSGGEQQMLAIARALMAGPKLLMLDEPSMGVAPLIARNLFLTISELNREGLTVLLVEQDVEASLCISTRGYVMQVGRVALEGSGQGLLANEEVKAIYMGKKSS
jgi:branched-chain amino acid transport system ATP-binding protein